MDLINAPACPSSELADLFNLDPRTVVVAKLPTIGKSADCTNDGCTGTCNSCGCSGTCGCDK